MIFLYQTERALHGVRATREFLGALLSQTDAELPQWWVNRKRLRPGQNVFEGGFLGLDNIGACSTGARSCLAGVI